MFSNINQLIWFFVYNFFFDILISNCFFFLFFLCSQCWFKPRGGLKKRSISSSSIPAPNSVMVVSKPSKKSAPSWVHSRRIVFAKKKICPKLNFSSSSFIHFFVIETTCFQSSTFKCNLAFELFFVQLLKFLYFSFFITKINCNLI